ncbi:DNA-binding protein [Paenibacillus favisporus]|uniref:DNA-binding protein n=1 Tax=Paenibacillus TaxID=44249 RepID=UPI0011AB59FC|nr:MULTISPECIES: DNA-binding protein [Paenibacillus]MEC0178323.1 DNA-binding protein [Paenibacillus favisporus]
MPKDKQDLTESDLPKLAQPAVRALRNAGITRLEEVAKLTEPELKQLHGIGPTAVKQLRRSMADKGLDFSK